MKKYLYAISVINILFQIIYFLFGAGTSGSMQWIFLVFRPEYMIISGIVSVVVFILLLVSVLKSRKTVCAMDIVSLILCVEYFVYWLNLMAVQ